MPSRAVVRKKARREAKRRRQDVHPPQTATEAPLPVKHEARDASATFAPRLADGHVPAARSSTHERRAAADDIAVAARKRTREQDDVVSPPPPQQQQQMQRLGDGTAATEEDMSSLSRKERKRLVARRRLEKEISRVNARAAVAAPADAAAATSDAASSPADGAPRLRHDPRFTHGTFWRTRKERRARTLFLGGVPASYTTAQVEELVSTVLDASDEARQYLDELQATSATAVEEVSLLPLGLRATVRNMYLVLASVPLADCVAAQLDGHVLEGRQLRCNFAADKYQREEAIRRREGGRTAAPRASHHARRY